MRQEITLEVELDLPLDAVDRDLYDDYIKAGATKQEAAYRVAQDLLGVMGAIVQGAEAVAS